MHKAWIGARAGYPEIVEVAEAHFAHFASKSKKKHLFLFLGKHFVLRLDESHL